jgi:hypothetical protein
MLSQYRTSKTLEKRDELFNRVLKKIDASKLSKEELDEIKYAIEEGFVSGTEIEREIMKECVEYLVKKA